MLTAYADSQQKPPVVTVVSKAGPDKVYSAMVRSMGAVGKILSQDRTGGVVQSGKGNWVLTSGIEAAGKGSRITISARYVPSDQFDFNSRDGLMKAVIENLQANLGEKLNVVQ